MIVMWTICALIVPWAAGTALVLLVRESLLAPTAARIPSRTADSFFLVIGAGWLAGQAMMMASLYISLIAFGAGHAHGILGVLALVALALICAIARRGWSAPSEDRSRPPDPIPVSTPTPLSAPERKSDPGEPTDAATDATAQPSRRWPAVVRRIILAIIAASLLAKLYLLICSHAFLPIRNDDAISIWLFKAKVIASLDRLPLSPEGDYYQAGSNPHYSIFVPLAAAWIPMVTGQWHEQLATLPWLFYYINLVLLIAGGLRRWLTAAQSWLAAYVVASLPLVVVHAYRPGYADMILAAFLAAAVMYLLIWRETNLVRHLGLATLFALVAACLKRESSALAAIAVATVLLSSRRNLQAWSARTWKGAVVAAGGAVLIVASLVDFSEQTGAASAFGYHPGVWAKLWQHLFEWSSFHFLFWGLAAAAILLSCIRHSPNRSPAILLTLGLCGFHVAVFLLTPQARFALNDQTPSRLFLQIVPSLVLAWAIPLSYALNVSAGVTSSAAAADEHKEVPHGQI